MKHFDFIIVGGGSAGCVLAARLSECANFSVLLIEAGGEDTSPLIKMPAGAVSMVPTHYNNWAFDTAPQQAMANRIGYQPRGKVLGGSSAINAMIYIRGHQQDYQDWAHLGWGWDDVLPYFIKSENNQNLYNDSNSKDLHGHNGPLYVSNSYSNHPIADAFVDAGVALGYPHIDDFNGFEQEGMGRYQVTQYKGQRFSASRSYLEPIRYRKNLTVITNTEVAKVILEDKVCKGIKTLDGKTYTAEKEVLLSAGAIKSPQILLLSGVGPKEQLENNNIKLQHELDGVGQNLQDHPDYVSCFESNRADLYGLSASAIPKMIKQAYQYFKNGQGILTSNFAETGGFLKTDKALQRPDIQFHFVIATVKDHARDWRTSLKHGFSNHTCVLRPKSVGSVTLKSNNPTDCPIIDPNFLAHEDDVNTMLAGVKMANQILQHDLIKRYQVCSINQDQNLDDNELIDKIKTLTDSVYHPIGTCKMGLLDDPSAVVNNQLEVIGIENLRVVDASVFPNLIGGNTNAPTIMVAERCADMIKEKWLNN